MTDRVYALSVALEHDICTDDIETIINCIRMLRGVAAVKMHISDLALWTAEERARHDLELKLWDVLYPKREKK